MNSIQHIAPSIMPTLFENMNEWVWIGDEENMTVYVNHRFREMSGYENRDVVGKDGTFYFDKETQERIHMEMETKRKKWLPSSYKGKLVKKDGTLIHVAVIGTPLPEWGSLGIITDISEHVEQKSSEKLLLSVVRQSLQGIILIKKEKIVSWNRGAKFIFGYKESEVSKKWLSTIFMKEDIRRIIDTVDEDIEVEVLGKRKDGERINLILTIVWSKDDPETGMILIRNISHIRKSETILSQKHDYLMMTVKEYGIIKRKLEYIQELERLFLSDKHELQKIYDFFVFSVAHIASVWWCWLRILGSDGNITLVAEYGLGNLRNGQHIRPYTWSITEESFHKGKPVRILDLMSDPRLRTLTMAHLQRFQSASMYSFHYKWRCIGSIMLFMEDGSDPFDDEFLMHYIELFGLLLGGRTRT